MRLDQVMNQAGLGSRNQVKRLLKSCQVQVDGQVERRPNRNVDPGLQEIKVQGQTLTQPAETYWLLHKPQGVLTAVKDDRFTTVVDCLAPQDQAPGLYPVGRLDRSTTGLVFLTTNGPLGYRMLHPQYHVEKEYQVVVNGPLTQDHVASFAQGILIDQNRPCGCQGDAASPSAHGPSGLRPGPSPWCLSAAEARRTGSIEALSLRIVMGNI